jgi:hypothetical protein
LLGLTILGLATIAGVGLFFLALASSLDTDKDLEDFASQAQARDFASAHLPTPLPSATVVEALHYERFTDWRLTARVRLTSPNAAAQYVDQLKQERKVDDNYCGSAEPGAGARYFLPALFACGTVKPGSPAATLEIACNTR